MKAFNRVVSSILRCLCLSFPVVMPAASPLMESAPSATPKSSLEIMLDTIRERDERQRDDGEPFLPPSPARPRGRGRPPTSARRPLPSGFKAGNGERAAPSTKRPHAGKNGAADVVYPAVETVRGDASSPDSDEEQSIREQGSGAEADKLVKEGEDDTVLWIHHCAIDIVDGAQQKDLESEINVEDQLDEAITSASASSIARVGCRTPGQSSRSASSPPRSSSGSSRGSEPGKRTKAGVGKLLTDSAGCVRAPVAAVARMVLNSCGTNRSGARALEQQTDHQGAEASLHDAAVKSSDMPGGGGDGDDAPTTVKALAAPSMVRSGVVWRWLKKISCRQGM